MKRYVREFAQDIRRSIVLAPKPVREEVNAKIGQVLNVCERGLVTDCEAIECLLKTVKEANREHHPQ